MRKFYICFVALWVYAALFGIVLPALFSAKSGVAVIIGLVVLCLSVVAPIHFVVNYVKKEKKDES